ncbi:hypothetical protein MKW98_000569 [Papaver atlanticum]|uniref:Uncharacterized protein n=1 Tax=Papaver atlanticum TaxID=357466 RepID=A0AAD4S468_9MAGN|nr:hypothetical protein MKW98_000569 [Papaver atlanticum]
MLSRNSARDSLHQLQLVYGEENAAMDVDSDTSDGITSSDSGVGTSPDVSDDECLPVAEEECCRQEGEEDVSSECSIEYHYSEEEYYQSGDDTDEEYLDEDVRNKEVGMTNSTATEKNEEIVSITDLALKYKYKLLSDSEVEDEKGYWNRISDSDKEDYSPPKPRPVCLPPVKKDFVYRPQKRCKPPLGPQFEIWVNSWEVKNHQTRFAWVNVYAYHNKNKGYGGYGVILRDWHAKPVTASAMYSSDAKSFFTQVLMGVKAGVVLAEKYGISELCVETIRLNFPVSLIYYGTALMLNVEMVQVFARGVWGLFLGVGVLIRAWCLLRGKIKLGHLKVNIYKICYDTRRV